MSAWENYHLEWSPDPLTVAIPSWQDITGYALAPFGAPIHIQTGIPVMGSGAQAATMAASLDNRDHRFTFGNTASPLSPNWKPGRRIRCYETIGNRRVDLFSGYIQPPETDDWAESGVDQYMAVVAVDRLGRLGVARTMVSTLAEHIIYNGGTALKAYWTLGDAAQPFQSVAGTSSAALLPSLSGSANTGRAAITPNSAIVAPADDLACARFTVATTAGASPIQSYQLFTSSLSPSVSLAAGQVLTAVAWLNPDVLVQPGSLYEVLSLDLTENAGVSHLAIFYDSSSSAAGIWGADIGLGALSGSINSGQGVALNTPIAVAVRYGYSPSVLECWIGNYRFTGTLSGSAPSSTVISQVTAPAAGFSGLYGHVQIYVGAAGDWDFAKYQAQVAMGATGLYGQTTGQRIVTLAQYAGIPAAELSNVDPGIAPMQKATLAGQSPLAEMRVAETTEQGRLRTNGQGLLVFDSRLRRYNS